MKAFKFLRVVILLGGILLSACTAAPASQSMTSPGSDKPVSEVVFTGMIESMDGSQWVVNGQTITVDSSTYLGSEKAVGHASFTVKDGTSPVVTILSPSPNQWFNSAIDVSATATDLASGIDRVEYQVDGGSWRLLPSQIFPEAGIPSHGVQRPLRKVSVRSRSGQSIGPEI